MAETVHTEIPSGFLINRFSRGEESLLLEVLNDAIGGMVAAVNLARRRRVRFARSRPPIPLEAQGRAGEAMKGNPTPTVIPGVDAPKLTQQTKS
jgi:hypothetical protein